jgi:cell division protease FtsH
MVAHWGMSERLGPVAYRTSEDHPFLGREIMQEHREFSEHTAQVIDEEVARMLHGAADRAQQMLLEHRAELDALSKALEEKEALDQADIEQILGPCANVLPSLNGTPTTAEENGQPPRAGVAEPTAAAPGKSKPD